MSCVDSQPQTEATACFPWSADIGEDKAALSLLVANCRIGVINE